jgi:hypothetical protein
VQTGANVIIQRIRSKGYEIIGPYLRKRHRPSVGDGSAAVAKLRQRINEIPPAAELEQEITDTWIEATQHLTENILRDDPSGFLQWSVVRHMMFVSRRPYTKIELDFLQSLSDWEDRYREAIREDIAGMPLPYARYRESSANLIHHAYHAAKFEADLGTPVSDFDSVIEFGAGYGSFCRLMVRLGFSGEYTLFDIPQVAALQEYYLSLVGISSDDDQIVPVSRSIRTNFLTEIEALEETFVSNNESQRSLFVALWSLSESPVHLRESLRSMIMNSNGFLIAYQLAHDGIDNVAWFTNIAESAEGLFKIVHHEIAHLPGNYYLFGIRQ